MDEMIIKEKYIKYKKEIDDTKIPSVEERNREIVRKDK